MPRKDIWKIKKSLEGFLKNNISGFQIVEKKNSSLMRFLSYLLFFSPRFMTDAWTTFYPKIYSTSSINEKTPRYIIEQYILLISHEAIHLLDRKRLWIVFNFLYLTPQIFSILAFLSFFNLWFLLSIVFLLPFPSLGRFWIEDRGYKANIASFFWLRGEKIDLEQFVNQFCGSSYYFMFPFRKFLTRRYESWYNLVKEDKNLPDYIRQIQHCFLSE